MENKKKSKSKILIMLFAIVLLVVGASFAIWNYSYSGTEENVLSSPDLSFRFLESNNEVISIDNGVPMKDEDGIKQSDTGNVFDFEVRSKASMDTDVSYDINLEKLSVDSGKTALSDSDIKVYIEDFEGNTVLKPTKVSDLSDYKLVTKVHRHSKSNSEISTKYKLKVWLDESVDVFSLEGKQYKFKIGVSTNQKEQDKNQTYSLVYNLDGGTGSITDSTFKVGDKVTISSTIPVKDGYKFLGWSTKKSASSASYKAGEEVTLDNVYDGKVTLYAVWQGKTYTIKYDSNGGTGSMDDSVFKLATDVRLSSNKFSKENYTFIGWSTSKGGEVTYTNEAKVKDLGGEGDVVTLYAVWKGDTYTVKYNPNGGVLNSSKEVAFDTKYVPDDDSVGSFNWVYSDGVYTSSQENALDTEEDDSPSQTSYVKPMFSKADVSNMFKEITLTEESTISFDWDVSDGYLDFFVVDSANNSKNYKSLYSDTVTSSPEYQTGNVVLPAGKYTLIFRFQAISNDGKAYVKNIKKLKSKYGNMESSSFEVGKDNKLSKNLYTKKGNDFLGWSASSDGEVVYKDEDSTSTIESALKGKHSVELFAKWKVNTFNVEVAVYNGTIDGDSEKTVNYGENATFNLTPSDSSYTNSTVSCSNGQKGVLKDNVLTVSGIDADTTCDVTYYSLSTVLYNDGTLILNEMSTDRSKNITTHGSVTKEYAPMDESNSYVFSSASDRPWNEDVSSIKYVEIGSKMSPTSTAYWFDSLLYMGKGDFTNLDTSDVTSMSHMFGMYDDFPSKAKTYNLIGLENWDTSNVTSMSHMFDRAGYSATTFNLDLSKWDVSNVTDMGSMFEFAGHNATTWSVGNLSNWNTSKVTNMRYMFVWAGKHSEIFSLNLSNWDVSNVADMYGMFYGIGYDASKWAVKIPKKTGSLNNSVSKLYGSSDSVYDEPDDGRQFTLPADVNVVVQDGSLASGETSSKSGWTGDSFTFGVVPNDSSLSGFASCTNSQSGSVKNNILTIKNVTSDTTCTITFDSVSTVLYNDGTLILNELGANRESNISTHGSVSKEYAPMDESNSYAFTASCIADYGCQSNVLWFEERNNILNVEIGNVIKPISTAYWFLDLENMKKGDFTNLEPSNVTDMSGMFYRTGCSATTFELNGLENWNVSNVTSMNYMFEDAGLNATIFNLNLSNWDTSSVTNMSGMFAFAGEKATTWNIGDISNWDTSSVTNMGSMFEDAGYSDTTWTIGDLSNWDTSSVTDMSYMFSEAGRSATTFNLNLSNWDTSSVTNMDYMFQVAGYNATKWTVKIPKKTGSLNNSVSKWYGSSDSIYAEPPSGKSFTLAS